MTTAAPTTPSGIALLIPARGTVAAVTDDGSDPRYAAVVEAATEIAVLAGGRVLLVCSPPGRGVLEARAPRLFVPDAAAGVAGRPHTGSRRRDLLVAEVAAIRARGVDVAVWLPSQAGPAASPRRSRSPLPPRSSCRRCPAVRASST